MAFSHPTFSGKPPLIDFTGQDLANADFTGANLNQVRSREEIHGNGEVILLMEEILRHLACIKPCKSCEI